VTPPLDDDTALDTARWYERLAELLGDVGRRVAQLGDQLANDWPDAHGREWADRTAHVGGVLGREAAAAGELGAVYARQTGDAGHFAGRRTGMRLGGTDAARAEDERGMRIAELGPSPSD
jgi:hypothetical protein